MDIKIKTEAKIGFIVLSTIILVIWGINFLKGRNVLKRTDVYYAIYENVQGLEYAAPVFINGYKVGLINDISFDKKRLDRFIVAFVVEKQYAIPKGSVVNIASPDIISGKALMVNLATSKEHHVYGDTLISGTEESMLSKLQTGIDPLIESAGNSMAQLDSLLSGLNNLLDVETRNSIQKSLKNTDELTGRINNQFAPEGNLTSAIRNLEMLSASLAANEDKFSNTIVNISNLSDTLVNSGIGKTMENITLVTNELHTLLYSMNSGEGTIGMLANDDSLYIKLVDVSSSLDLLLQDMKDRPKRYVHFSLFGRKDKI